MNFESSSNWSWRIVHYINHLFTFILVCFSGPQKLLCYIVWFSLKIHVIAVPYQIESCVCQEQLACVIAKRNKCNTDYSSGLWQLKLPKLFVSKNICSIDFAGKVLGVEFTPPSLILNSHWLNSHNSDWIFFDRLCVILRQIVCKSISTRQRNSPPPWLGPRFRATSLANKQTTVSDAIDSHFGRAINFTTRSTLGALCTGHGLGR